MIRVNAFRFPWPKNLAFAISHCKMCPERCRAARDWLDWPQQELAKRSNVGLSTIRQFENGIRTPIANNLSAMRRAFEEAGITLTDEPAGISYCEARTTAGASESHLTT